MKERPLPYPHRHLTLEEISKVKKFYDKHGIKWSKKRGEILQQGHRGRCDVHAYKRYCRLLRRISYEMNCVKHDIPIRIEGNSHILDIPYNKKFMSRFS